MIYFVSGHRDLTKEEFEEHYVPLIQKVLKSDIFPEFIVGDWEGCDSMFLNFIKDYEVHVIITYVEEIPRIDITGASWLRLKTYDKCDEQMTITSDFDIAWIRPGREDSHTAKNIKRRYGPYN